VSLLLALAKDLHGKMSPSFSIIIPTYNRPEQLVVCLEALTKLNYPADHFEVIIVDDGSEISPDRVVASFRHLLDITLIRQVHAGVAIGRNTGAAKAKGELFLRTTIVSPHRTGFKD